MFFFIRKLNTLVPVYTLMDRAPQQIMRDRLYMGRAHTGQGRHSTEMRLSYYYRLGNNNVGDMISNRSGNRGIISAHGVCSIASCTNITVTCDDK